MQDTPDLRSPKAGDDGSGRHPMQLPPLQLGSTLGQAGLNSKAFSANARMPPFYPTQDLEGSSPAESALMTGEMYRTPLPQGGMASPGHLNSLMAQNPKRAYRQRRKDPSCDACRERKVKCDATETTSCTECSSRNVRCQFTKDTNRRMSSIKQVQDLERQLFDARQQLERLRAAEPKVDSPELYGQNISQVLAELPAVGRSPRRMLKARTPNNLGNARAQLMDVGRGLLKPPVRAAYPEIDQGEDLPFSELPPRAAAEQLLRVYFECIHRRFPVLYWPDIQADFTKIYEQGQSAKLPKETVALLFAILACGALCLDPPTHNGHGQKFLSIAISRLDLWVEDLSVSQALVTFLVSLFLAEMNRKSASWIWLGSSIRIAQDLGLHVQGGQWSAVEGEMRKRIWWSFYVWDRLLATEMGKPMLINDDDCDTEYPEALEDESSSTADILDPQQPTTLLATIHVSRLLSPLAKLTKSLCITNEALSRFESHLATCLYILPPRLQISSSSPLDLLIISPTIYFQNARLMLHRHNLSPSCSHEQRHQAIQQCLLASRETANIVSRCLIQQAGDDDWEDRCLSAATTLMCTHFWRCMLFLIFRQEFEAFFTILRLSSTIGNSKLVNISCGRYLLLFVQKFVEKAQRSTISSVDQDEELIAFLSGDVQGETSAWVWGSAETGTLLSRRQKHGRPRNAGSDAVLETLVETKDAWDSLLSEEEQQSWGSWELIERTARQLQNMYLASPESQSSQTGLPLLFRQHTQEDSQTQSEPSRGESTSADSSSRSKMNIANII